MFKIVRVSKRISSKIILDDVSFGVNRGEIVVLLGASGVGKSSLLRLLNNLESYDTGEFFLDDRKLNLQEVNQDHTIGMVFQHFNLFENLTVRNNITLALIHTQNKRKKDAIDIAESLLARYSLLDKADTYVHKLSGGQKQRLAIARTLALNPQVICLDEPTSALDPNLTSQVAECIQELAADNRIVLIATHDIALTKQLDCQIFLMEKGKIVEKAHSKAYYPNSAAYPKLQVFLREK